MFLKWQAAIGVIIVSIGVSIVNIRYLGNGFLLIIIGVIIAVAALRELDDRKKTLEVVAYFEPSPSLQTQIETLDNAVVQTKISFYPYELILTTIDDLTRDFE